MVKKIKKKCENCETEFEIYAYKIKMGKGRFCSQKCANGARIVSNETKEKLRNAMKNRKFTEEWKQKISNAKKGKPMSEQQKMNLSKGWKKENNKPCKEETKQKISKKLMGHEVKEETRQKLHETHLGEKAPNWKGGISFEPYCPKFNENLKLRVRAFFEYRCIICGKHENECNKKHCVHHVEYNKQACCDGKPVHFAILCTKHHTKTNNDRERWEEMFHRVIDEVYNGRSYFTTEEWKFLSKNG